MEVSPVANPSVGEPGFARHAKNLTGVAPEVFRLPCRLRAGRIEPASGQRLMKWTRLPALWLGSRVLRVRTYSSSVVDQPTSQEIAADCYSHLALALLLRRKRKTRRLH